jgi:hypothetical protein
VSLRPRQTPEALTEAVSLTAAFGRTARIEPALLSDEQMLAMTSVPLRTTSAVAAAVTRSASSISCGCLRISDISGRCGRSRAGSVVRCEADDGGGAGAVETGPVLETAYTT